MPFKTLDDVVDPATYQKNLLAGLKNSVGKVAKLHYFEGFPFANQTAALVLVGPVDGKLLQKIAERGAKLRAKGSVTEAENKKQLSINRREGAKIEVMKGRLLRGDFFQQAIAIDLTDTDPKNMLPITSPVRRYNDQVEGWFGLHPDVIVVGIWSERGIFTPESLARVARLTDGILRLPGVIARDVVHRIGGDEGPRATAEPDQRSDARRARRARSP